MNYLKKERIITLGLAATLTAGFSAGCGASSGNTPPSSDPSASSVTATSIAETASQGTSSPEPSQVESVEKSDASNAPLRIGVAAYDGSSFDPIVASDGFSIAILGNIIGGLYNYDDNNVPQLELAKSVDESDDGLTQTFTLRDATWSDGEPLTADDFVYAWERLADPSSGSEMSYLIGDAHIKNAQDILAGKADPSTLGVTAVDDKTLKVDFDQPCPYFSSLSSFSALSPPPTQIC